MLSRVADSLYWMSRYLERAEHTARLVDVNLEPHARPRARPTPRGTGAGCWRACPTPPPWESRPVPDAVERADRRPRQPRVDRRLRRRGARERAPGARGDQLRDVGADQPAVPAVQQRQPIESEWTAGTHEFLTVDDRRRAPVPGRHRRDDEARRRLALHRARPLSRARQRHGGAARRAVPRRRRPTEQPAGVSELRRVGRAAEVVLRVRGLLPALHRRSAARAHRRVPAAQPGFPASDPLRRGRVEAALRAIAGLTGRVERTRRAARRPAARLARLRPDRRDHGRASGVSSGHRAPGAPRSTRARVSASTSPIPIDSGDLA